jgi:hypothetical protein
VVDGQRSQSFPRRVWIGESCDEWSLSKPEEQRYCEYLSIQEHDATLAALKAENEKLREHLIGVQHERDLNSESLGL